mgnify:CR=1 FL=1
MRAPSDVKWHARSANCNKTRSINMTDKKLYIERRPRGDYTIRKADSDRASATAQTQAEAIEKARRLNPEATILVERVRNTDKGRRDKWRKP